MKIKIYGSGCDKCKKLYANAETAAKSAGIDAEIEKITDMDAIVAAGIMMTPALMIDGTVVSSGKVPSASEIAVFFGDTPKSSCNKDADADAKSPSCGCGCGASTASSPAKRIITLLLLLFALISIGVMVYRENKASVPAPADAAEITVPIKKGTLVVYYFHGERRCMTCNKIEDLTQKALEAKFAPELKNGSILFKSVNLDEPQNEHFVQDFNLDSKIVVMQRGDQFEKFQDVWTLVKTPEKLAIYIQNGVEKLK